MYSDKIEILDQLFGDSYELLHLKACTWKGNGIPMEWDSDWNMSHAPSLLILRHIRRIFWIWIPILYAFSIVSIAVA